MRRPLLLALALLLRPAPAPAQDPPADPPADPCAALTDDPDTERDTQSAFSRRALDRETQDARRLAICRIAAPYAGRPLAPLRVDCDIDVCQDPTRHDALIRLTGLEDAITLDPRAAAAAWLRLQRTGFFQRVDMRVEDPPGPPAEGTTESPAEAPPGAIRLVFQATGHVVITDLDVEYVGWQSRLYPRLFRDEIRKRLPLRRGGSFPPLGPDGELAPRDAARLLEWSERVEALYEQLGFVGTRVVIEPEFQGPENKKVRVVVRLDEGQQPEIGEILVKGNRAFPYWKVVEPLTTGERVDLFREFFAAFGIGRYARRELKDELEEVEQRYREEGYVTARARLESRLAAAGDQVFPRVRLFEGPHLEVRFTGNESLDDAELREVLTFAENGAIDDTEVESSREAIIAAYQTIARYDVQVFAELDRRDADHFVAEFTIDEGNRVYVREVQIHGNRRVTDDELFAVMETQGIAPDGVINAFATSAGVLQDARVTNDLLAIRDLYRDRGMPGLRFRCGDPKRTTARERNAILAAADAPPDFGPALGPAATTRLDLWTDDPVNHICFQVIPQDDPRLVILRVELDEGLQTTVDRLDINPVLRRMDPQMRDEAYDLLRELGFVDETRRWRRAGLNRKKLDAVRGFLLRYHHQRGYIGAEVIPVCLPDHPDALTTTDDCTDQRLYGRHLHSIGFRTTEGRRTVVDGILLQGNLRTDRDVIESELLFADGRPLGTDDLFRSQANLRSLGVFDSVLVETIGESDTTPADADRTEAAVVVTVEESDYRFADLYIGAQIDSTPLDENLPVLYSVGGSIRDRNLFGRALEVGAGLNFINRFDAPLTVTEYDETVFEAGPFLKDRRLLGTRLDLTIEATYKRGRTAQRDAYEEVIGFRPTIGYDFYNLSYPADWGRGLRATLVTDYRWERRRALVRSTGEVPLFGDSTQSISLEPTLTWDRRDSPLHPTRGGLVIVSSEIVFNAFNRLEAFVLEPSFKETLTAQYVRSFFDRQLIVVPTLRLGAVQTDQDEADLKSGFFFKAGGDGVALPVRGYGDAVIEACRGRDDPTDPFCDSVLPEGFDDDGSLVDRQRIGGKAMLLGSVELRFPTFIIDDFWWAVFSDVGAVAPTWTDMAFDRFYPSAGAGLRWLVTGQIPLRLDLAWPLRPDPFEPQTLRVHLNIFYTL
ncbi:MAG: BamA/TamA family outer membrane protein [Myxococcales bacterium]|nr:BamA/TamA family outer membrane protein [Myxococcales bacterium]